ncbi:MAG: amidohydrolase family protein [Spirochaetes bacterium]|nr:amidohydrolase family protein [Spirochaetota bacterium]MBU1080055.1 amidohydrolase family protein [Spirochaetota bacterium]
MGERVVIKGARAIVSCDPSDTLYRGADILVEGPAVVAIGPGLDSGGAEIIDAGGMFVYPGLVNTHHHFFQTFVRNLAAVDYPSLSVLDWIGKIYEIFKLIDERAVYYSSLAAMADLLKHGCTCAFDHQYCFPRRAGKRLVDRQMEAASLLGIRYHAGRGANTLPKAEGSLIPDEMLETTDEFLADCDRLIGLYHSDEPFRMTDVVVSPCQPVNCRRETFVESVALARDRGVRLHTHLGEGENAPMLERWGKRTLAWCEDLGFVGPDVWYAHGWELEPGEYRAMASTGTGLSHCPAPAILGGFPVLDIPALGRAGVRLGLGCDGSATNDSSNLLDSLRVAWMMQASRGKERGGCPSAYDMLKIATAGGAGLLGRGDLGSLEPGKAADLFMVDASGLEFAGADHDPANFLARLGATGPVSLTMVNGKVVYEGGRLVGVDEERLAAEAAEACDGAVRSRSPAYSGYARR